MSFTCQATLFAQQLDLRGQRLDRMLLRHLPIAEQNDVHVFAHRHEAQPARFGMPRKFGGAATVTAWPRRKSSAPKTSCGCTSPREPSGASSTFIAPRSALGAGSS